jgi:hypothetical protein
MTDAIHVLHVHRTEKRSLKHFTSPNPIRQLPRIPEPQVALHLTRSRVVGQLKLFECEHAFVSQRSITHWVVEVPASIASIVATI